jgi:hypothetical protein
MGFGRIPVTVPVGHSLLGEYQPLIAGAACKLKD